MCKKLIMGPAKSTEVSPEGDFKDSITRKRWLGKKGKRSAMTMDDMGPARKVSTCFKYFDAVS